MPTTDERDLLPEKVILRGRDKGDVVRITPYFVKPVRLFRGVEVALGRLPQVGPPRFDLSEEEEIEQERNYPPPRLKKFAAALAKRFGLAPRAFRVRCHRGVYQLYLHLWEGAGTEADFKKLRVVMKYIEKSASKI